MSANKAEISNFTKSVRTVALSEYEYVHYLVIARWCAVTVQIKQHVVPNNLSKFWLIF
jgi:glucose uptake protein GlcU